MYRNKIFVKYSKKNKILYDIVIETIQNLGEKTKKKDSSFKDFSNFVTSKKRLDIKNISIINDILKSADNLNYEVNQILSFIRKNVFVHYYNELKHNKIEKCFLNTEKKLYFLKKIIGNGGNSTVFLVKDNEKNEYSLKFFTGKKNRKFGFLKEIKYLTKFNHVNILKAIDSYVDDTHCFMITKFYKYSLDTFINKKHKNENIFNTDYNITLEYYFLMAFALLDSLIYCEQKGFYHNDIKDDNILFDNFNNIVLGDFGTIGKKNREKDKEPVRNGRTPSPEQLIDDRSDMSKSDVYSIGLILNKLLTKTYPVGNNYAEVSDKYPDIVFIDYIISRMLEQKKEKRLNLQSAKNYFKFFYEIRNLNNLENYKNTVKNNQSYIEKVKLDLSPYKDFYNNNIEYYTFKVSYHSHKIIDSYISLYVKDITTYNENEKKLLDEEVIFDTSFSDNFLDVTFYDIGKFLMINIKYKNGYSKILFKYKCFIKEYLNLYDSTIRDYSIYINDRLEYKFKNNDRNFFIFEMNHKEFFYNKIKFIFFDGGINYSNLYFILDDILYPMPLTKTNYNKVKDIIKSHNEQFLK